MSKNNDDVSTAVQSPAEKREIPFGKPFRIGNYKVWRSKKKVGTGKDKVDVEQINICNLDEDWHIKIPSTVGMFSMIRELFAAGDSNHLVYFFNNMQYASIVPNGYFHQAINMVATVYANPDILCDDDEQHEVLVSNVKALIKGFLDWRKEYDRQMAANSPTDDEIRNDEIAEDMMKVAAEMEDEK